MTLAQATPTRRADRTWRGFWARVTAIAPQSVGRLLIVLAVFALVGWVAFASWPSLAPYGVGALIGYIILPVVNRLDSIMPRTLAGIVALIGFFAVFGLFFVVVIPPLISSIGRLIELLPPPGTVSGAVGDFEAWLLTMPEPLSNVAVDVLHGVLAGLSAALTGLVAGLTNFLVNQTLGILSTLNFVFGLVVLPVWITAYLTSHRVAKTSTLRILPPGARADGDAVIRIVDRAAATYLRVQVLQAILTAVFVWMGLAIASSLGFPIGPQAQVAIAALLGAFQLVPSIGFILGFLIVGLDLLLEGPVNAAALAAIYVGATSLGGRVAASRARGGTRDVHPVVLVPILVALAEFGIVWLLLAAPLIGIVVDLARYGWGRLGDPPAPAGVIPSQPNPPTTTAPAAPVPSSYRTLATQR